VDKIQILKDLSTSRTGAWMPLMLSSNMKSEVVIKINMMCSIELGSNMMGDRK